MTMEDEGHMGRFALLTTSYFLMPTLSVKVGTVMMLPADWYSENRPEIVPPGH
jgi:hypothetical protein